MLLDLKPKDLLVYEGKSPKPHDFDKFWDNALEELKQIEPCTELISCKWNFRNAEAYDMYFTGIDNARIHAKYIRPANVDKSPVIFTFHGYSLSSWSWMEMLALLSQGYSVVSMDCRGQGGCSEDKGNVKGNTLNGHIIRGLDSQSPRDLLYVKIFLDVSQLVSIVEKFDETDEKNMFAMGTSQGGALTYVCASLCPQIKAAAACYPFLSDYRRVWEMDMAERAYVELKEYFRAFDPRHEREDEVFLKLGYIDIQNLASRIKGRMLMFTGLMDNICPPSTQFAAYNKVTSEKKVIFYPDYRHEKLPDWIEISLDWFSK